MNDAPAPPSDAAAPAPSSRKLRQKQRRNPWTRRLGWSVSVLVLLGIVAAFSLRIWVAQYLKSAAFAAQLSATAGRALLANCQFEGLSWQDSTGYVGTFSADGLDAAAFQKITVSEARAEVDLTAVWDRVWQVNQIKIAQVTADFSTGERALAEANAATVESSAPSHLVDSHPWLQRWLPHRTEIGTVQVERFDFLKKAASGMPSWQGSGFSLTLKPNLKSSTLVVEGRTGTIHLAGEPSALKVEHVRTTLRPDEASLDQLEGIFKEAKVTAEGTIDLKPAGDLRLSVRIANVSLERWLPEDWLRRCHGQASAKATLRGDWRQPEKLQANGDFKITDATLQALPLLDILAKKTQNASFLRMQIKVAEGNFERRRADHWELRQLRADAPGLLRLKGGVDFGEDGKLRGSLLLGIVPGTLRYLAGAEQTVFLTADHFSSITGNTGILSADDAPLLWTRFQLKGTLDLPLEDLSERLAKAWFNATVDEVATLSMEAAATVTRNAASTVNTVLETAPPLLQNAPDLLQQSVQGGLKALDDLLPR